jgi:glycosyltransferase involved in cell wall biosynthesis
LADSERGAEASHPGPRAFDQALRYKQLLVINEYPPSTIAGAPVIARQLFGRYDPERMDVLCSGSWYDNVTPTVRETFLPCRHTSIRSFKSNFRPRRVFEPVDSTLDCARLPWILRVARRIARERGVEALFTTSLGAEFPHAAYFLAKELSLPLYYFEMDRLDSVFTSPAAEWLIRRYRRDFLRSVERLWLISPAMVREFKALYGVDGHFMHHFVNIERYQQVTREAPPLPNDRIELVYTGSINSMFLDSMRWFAAWLNRGLSIDGRPVELSIYSAWCPPELVGRHVKYHGLVKSEQIPSKLAAAHAALILVSFTDEKGVKEQIRTSIYTKTIDYLASGRPVLVVSPDYAGEVDYFGGVTEVVNRLDETAIVAALRRIVDDPAHADALSARGLELVRKRHSESAIDEIFLSHFRTREAPKPRAR